MTDEADINEALVQSATGPKRVQVAGMGESEDHSIGDQIAAAKHVANAAAASNPFACLRFTKINPPGAR